MRGSLTTLVCVLFLSAPAAAETVVLEPDRDATLIEDPAGARANGSGPLMFAGRTSQSPNSIRRALLRFDLAGALPRGAVVENVELRLQNTGGNNAPRTFRVHRMLAGWSEGPSIAQGGGGVPAGPGDVTWTHAEFGLDRWSRPGGQFVGRASASRVVGGAGPYAWSDNPQLLLDVRRWLAAPHRNFGWILIGDETTAQNAKRFGSRENPDAAVRPRLEITYRLR